MSATKSPLSRLGPADSVVLAACVGLLAGFSLIQPNVAYPPPPNFAEMPVEEKKRQFFAYLSPMISAVNFELAAHRDRAADLRAAHARGERLRWSDRRWLRRLAIRLEVDLDSMGLAEALQTLYRRAGIVPESIALVQAAIESGWGTSRFALEAHNYFGQRCYMSNCGIIPTERREGARFALAEFASPHASVESYMLNLNTHPSYREFRDLRNQRRVAGEPVTGLALIAGLTNYSVRRDEYVDQVASMIRSNNLE